MYTVQYMIKNIQDGDDMCMICFTEALHPIPSILLHCGHVFHYNCVRLDLFKFFSQFTHILNGLWKNFKIFPKKEVGTELYTSKKGPKLIC